MLNKICNQTSASCVFHLTHAADTYLSERIRCCRICGANASKSSMMMTIGGLSPVYKVKHYDIMTGSTKIS